MLNNEYYVIKTFPIFSFENKDFDNLLFTKFDILNRLQKYDLILKIIIFFHDYENLYLVSKFYSRNIKIEKDKFWNESQIQFFSACIIQALSYLRKEEIIHRDLHFGNIVFDNDNYVNLIDFHIAIDYKNKDNNFGPNISITSPEMENHLIYDYNTDYYSLGCLIYYVMFQSWFKYKLLALNPIEIKNYSYNLIDFVNQLLIIDPMKRIGYKNIDELKKHNFFNNFDWDSLNKRILKSPFPNEIEKSVESLNNKENISNIINIFKNNSFIKNLNKYFNENTEFESQIIRNLEKKIP